MSDLLSLVGWTFLPNVCNPPTPLFLDSRN